MCRGRLIRKLAPQFRVSVTEIGKTTHLSLRTVCNSLTFSVASKRLNLGPKSKSSKFSFFVEAGIKSGSILFMSSTYKLKYNFFVQCSITLCCMCVLMPCNNRKWFIYAENITRKISLIFQNIFRQIKHENVKKGYLMSVIHLCLSCKLYISFICVHVLMRRNTVKQDLHQGEFTPAGNGTCSARQV